MSKLVLEFDMSGGHTLGEIVACAERTLAAIKEHANPAWTYAQIRSHTDAGAAFSVMCEVTQPNTTLADGTVFGRLVLTDIPLDKTAYSLKQRDHNGHTNGVLDVTTGKTLKAP